MQVKPLICLCLSLGMALPGMPMARPALAEVQNMDYNQREIEITAEGKTADEALSNCEQAALEEAVKALVQTDDEQAKYQKLRAQLLGARAQYLKRLKIVGKGTTDSGGRFYTILFRVEVGQLRDTLVKAGVILSSGQLSTELNSPVIVAYYHDPLDTSSYATWSVERIHNFLLAHQFKVVDAKVWQDLAQDDALVAQGKGNAQRLGQVLALKAKADLVLEIEISPTLVGRSGDYTYIQTPVRIKAYEASSGEPFITKVYQRLNRDGQPEALAIKGNVDVTAKAVIEEAVAGVMPLLLEDLTRYWKQSLVKGQQYRLIFRNLPASREAELASDLQGLVKDIKPVSKGNYLVRYHGVLGDLADELEEKLGDSFGLKLDSFDLGNATFVCS
ncbi:MAG: hypothetical protein ACAI44_15105 [Candidatus Sericytochromatia bacterium]